MAQGVNDMVGSHIAVKKKAMGVFGEFGKGNLEADLEKLPGKKRFINDTIDKVRQNLKDLVSELNRMSTEHDRGDIDVAIDVRRFEGAYATMAEGVNKMVGGHIAVKRKAMACVAEFGKGNFEAPLEKFPGKKAFINETIEQVRANLKALGTDANLLRGCCPGREAHHPSRRVEAPGGLPQDRGRRQPNARRGTCPHPGGGAGAGKAGGARPKSEGARRLPGRPRQDQGKPERHRGSAPRCDLAGGERGGAGLVGIHPDRRLIAGGCRGSLRAGVQPGRNEHIGGVGREHDEAVGRQRAAGEPTRGRRAYRRYRGRSVGGADDLSDGRIKASAEGTSQIIKDINDIAFQTNLLALNAAVEAARAGEAGRGFAVVAEEVRSLALRAKEAATKTEELIRQSVKEAGEGEVTAKHVAGKLGEIVAGIGKVSAIVSEIATASNEQAAGINQVNQAVAEMDKVTQQNAASAEESSSAASELSGQSEELASMVAAFQVEGRAVAARAPAVQRVAPKAVPARLPTKTAPKANGTNGTHKGLALQAHVVDSFPMEGDSDTKDF